MIDAIKYWWRYSDSAALLIVIAVSSAVIAALVALIFAGVVWECGAYKDTTGRNTKVAAVTCYVQGDDGRWYAWEEWKLRGATKGN